MERFDALILGAGQAGVPLARDLAAAGWKVALVEREHVGGTCLNEGCTPTKTMVASARVAYLARRAGDFGVQTGLVAVDMERVRARKRDIVASWRAGSERRLQRAENLELVMGQARFVEAGAVEVVTAEGVRRLESPRIVVNTGARPAIPDLPGLSDIPSLTSTSVMELGAVPPHLLVLGGGYVGVEFAQMYRRFGSEVTILQRRSRLLPREDPDVCEAVAAILREDGVEIVYGARATAVRVAGAGGVGTEGVAGVGDEGARVIELTAEVGEEERKFRGSHLLVAAGRTPNTDMLNLPAAGIGTDDRGYIAVDPSLRTSVPGVWALGDVNGGPAFTHVSYDDYRILRDHLLHGVDRTTADRPVPYCVYIDPELGRVGLGETQARERGLAVKVATMPMSHVARALEMDEARGFMKVVVDAQTDRILGCAVLGVAGGEIMSLIQTAMMGGVTATTLREAVWAHPALAEALNNLLARLE